jgi:small membrane protein
MLHQLNLFQLIFVPILSLLFFHSLVLMTRGVGWRTSGIRALLWFAAAMAVLRPQMTITIAQSVGIGRGTDLILYLFILGSLGAAFYFYGRVVKLENAITTLVRQAALRDRAKS